MQIISCDFLIFFLCSLIVYHIIPSRLKCAFLLLASYIFYGSHSVGYLGFLCFATLLSYGGALLIDKLHENINGKRIVLALTIGFNLLLLGYFKYASFFTGGKIQSLLMPVGISFYLFMACGYLVDVYRKKIVSEKNLICYALFVSFFPTILSGPIERAGNMLVQFKTSFMKEVSFDTDRIRDGFVRILWGCFMKLVLADRIAIWVNAVYQSHQSHGGALVLVAAILYTFQIYCDFAGYSNIALGIGETFGIRIMENFRCPYLATSISDFWRRWHISLSSWFRDYVYIPLGGNRKGTVRKYINIMLVFLLSGLWHGAGWTFVIWGGLHGLYQVLGAVLSPIRNKVKKALNLNEAMVSLKILQIVVTFGLVSFAWMFFRAGSMTEIVSIFRCFQRMQIWELFDGTIYTLGLDSANIFVMVVGLIVLFIVELCNERGIFISKRIAKERLWVRWPIYIIAILVVLIYGVWGSGYDTSSFIYYQF